MTGAWEASEKSAVQQMERVITPLRVAPETFEAFYRREYRSIVAMGYALCGSVSVAEDIAQEAFIVAHRRWTELRDMEIPGAWVRRVASNKAVSFVRRRQAEARALTRLGSHRQQVVELEIPDREFWAEVRRLPDQQAKAIALHYLEDRPVDEIAEILDCAPSTARVHLHRGRQTLADRFGLEVSE